MEKYQIRKAGIADIEIIARFQLEMAMETEKLRLELPVVLQGVRAVIDNENKGSYFVCEINGEVVASLLITFEWSDWRNAFIYWLQSVYVLKDYRRMGIFHNMYLFVKKMADDDPAVAGIRLYVDKSNNTARKVYEKAGMSGDHYVTYEWMKPL